LAKSRHAEDSSRYGEEGGLHDGCLDLTLLQRVVEMMNEKRLALE
jgi:hypothetical protein